MLITFLGTGSSIPNPRGPLTQPRSYSAILITIGETTLLFDIGPGTLTKLHQLGVNTQYHPTHLFFTHFHLDHCLDYLGLIKQRALAQSQNQLKVYGPPDLSQFTNQLFDGIGRWNYIKSGLKALNYCQLKDVASGVVEENDQWRVTAVPVPHYDGLAYRVDSGGRSFVFSGDMAYDEGILAIAQDADVVAIECSFPNRELLAGAHLCPEDVGKLAQKGNFKQTVLTHLYPHCEGLEQNMLNQVRTLAPNTNATIAYDFMQINL